MSKDPNSRVIKWKILLYKFYFDIEYLKEKRVDLIHASLNSVCGTEENLYKDFFIINKIVNKYRTHIRIVKHKNKKN